MSSPFKTFACLTYGCKVNFADSSTISRQLIDLGYSIENIAVFCLVYTAISILIVFIFRKTYKPILQNRT